MAKKQKVKYELALLGTDIKFDDIKLVQVPEKPDTQRRFWIEFDGDRARLMVSQDVLGEIEESVTLNITRHNEVGMPSELVTPIGEMTFTMYNVIRAGRNCKKFYYIDEYYPGQLRLTHSENFFDRGFEHSEIKGYEIRKVI